MTKSEKIKIYKIYIVILPNLMQKRETAVFALGQHDTTFFFMPFHQKCTSFVEPNKAINQRAHRIKSRVFHIHVLMYVCVYVWVCEQSLVPRHLHFIVSSFCKSFVSQLSTRTGITKKGKTCCEFSIIFMNLLNYLTASHFRFEFPCSYATFFRFY